MKKQSPGAERQEFYRWRHPQINITLQSPEEQRLIRQACVTTHDATTSLVGLGRARTGGSAISTLARLTPRPSALPCHGVT